MPSPQTPMTSPTEKVYAVTGATGHLGLNLVLQVLERGHTAIALHHQRRVPELLRGRERLSFHRVDILDPRGLTEALSGVDGVFHVAGKISIEGDRDGDVWRCNVEGTKNVVTAALAAGVRRLVHCSSIHALKIDPWTQTVSESLDLATDQKHRPVYDRSKAASMIAVENARERGLSVVTVLPSGVIGPHDPEPSRMGRVFLAVQRRSLPALTGGSFDFVDVRDVAIGMMNAMTKSQPRLRYVLGGHFVTLVDLIRMAADSSRVSPPHLVAPLSLARWTAPLALAWSRLRNREPLYTPESIQALGMGRSTDFRLAERELDYHPRALIETIDDLYTSFDNPTAVLL